MHLQRNVFVLVLIIMFGLGTLAGYFIQNSKKSEASSNFTTATTIKPTQPSSAVAIPSSNPNQAATDTALGSDTDGQLLNATIGTALTEVLNNSDIHSNTPAPTTTPSTDSNSLHRLPSPSEASPTSLLDKIKGHLVPKAEAQATTPCSASYDSAVNQGLLQSLGYNNVNSPLNLKYKNNAVPPKTFACDWGRNISGNGHIEFYSSSVDSNALYLRIYFSTTRPPSPGGPLIPARFDGIVVTDTFTNYKNPSNPTTLTDRTVYNYGPPPSICQNLGIDIKPNLVFDYRVFPTSTGSYYFQPLNDDKDCPHGAVFALNCATSMKLSLDYTNPFYSTEICKATSSRRVPPGYPMWPYR